MELEITYLYEAHDAAYVAAAPWRWSALATRALLANPFNPLAYTAAGRVLDAAASVASGVLERRGKPPWNVAAEMTTIDERPFGRLIRFSTAAGRAVPRVLLVAPMSGHYATLLRGTVAALVAAHDVYVTDWADARDVPLAAGSFDLDEYIAYLLAYVRLLGPDAHVIAVCQPAPAVLAAVALLAAENDAAQPRSMTLMGGPIDTRVAPTAPTELALTRPLQWFSDELVVTVPAYYAGAGRRVYPGFTQLAAFLSMNASRHIDAHVGMFNDLVRGDDESAHARRAFYDEYLSVMDVTGEYFLTTVDQVFQRHALPLGTMLWRGHRVDPTAIRDTALQTVEGEFDDISAPGQTFAAHDLCPNIPAGRRDHLVEPGVGHYGIFNGRHWRDTIEPRIAAFITAMA